MDITYNFEQIMPKIFLLEISDKYDLAMTFWRGQEFYESGNDEFRGKSFTQSEYMRWYAKALGKGSFTYSSDWSGFNIPSSELEECYKMTEEKLIYDNFMLEVMSSCRHLSGDTPYYLIGANPKSSGVLDHEIAHGLFQTDIEYRERIVLKLENIDVETRDKFCRLLSSMGYGDNVHADEMQAYMCTGLIEKMDFVSKQQCEPFIEIFSSFGKINSRKTYSPVTRSF